MKRNVSPYHAQQSKLHKTGCETSLTGFGPL